MAAEATRHTLHADAPLPLTHTDTDYTAGVTFVARCDAAQVYIGGPTVTNSTGASPGYPVPAGQEFGLSDSADPVYVAVDDANDGAELFVFWAGV